MSMAEAIKAIMMQAIGEIHTSIPARIDKYDPLKMRAEVVPLAKVNINGQMMDMPKVVEVPVSYLRAGAFIIRPPYVPGDIVLVVFSERAIDNLLASARTADPQIKRVFALDDAMVVAGLQTQDKDDTPSEATDGLWIGHTGKNTRVIWQNNGDLEAKMTKVTMKFTESTGDVELNTDGKLTVNAKGDALVHADGNAKVDATGDSTVSAGGSVYLGQDGAPHPVSFADIVAAKFDGHTHTYTWAHDPGSGKTGTPTPVMATDIASPKVMTS
jgi:hypothetical protein